MVWAARFSPGFAGAGVTFSGAPDFPAALAILTATQRLLVAATIRAPLGSEAALFPGGRASQADVAAAALALQTAAQRFLCAAAFVST
jgi:hypothetical protein